MTAKVLVADNNVTQKIVTMAFKSEAVEITGVASGPAAWDLMQELQPDIVLADINLPSLSGFDLSRKIKESDQFESVRVVLLSSDFEDLDQKKFQQSKADDYLSKPFKSGDLVAKVRGLLALESLPETLSSDDAAPPTDEPGKEAEVTLPDDRETLPAADLEPPETEPIPLSAGDQLEDLEPDPGETEAPPPASNDTPLDQGTFPPILELRLDDLVIQDAGEEESFSGDEILEDAIPGNETPEDEIFENDEILAPEVPAEEILVKEVPEDEEAWQTPEVAKTEPSSLEEPSDPASPEPSASEAPDPPSFKAEAYLLTDDAQTAFDESLVPDPPVPAPAEIKAPPADPAPKVTSPQSQEAPAVQPARAADRGSMEEEIGESQRAAAPLEELDKTFRSLSGQSPAQEAQPGSPPPLPPREAGGAEPDLIRETLAFLSEKSGIRPPPPEPAPWPVTSRKETGGVSFDGVMEAHALRLLETSLERSLKQEIEGLSDSIIEVVRDVVKEVAPGIVRRTIQEEIENLRKMEEV